MCDGDYRILAYGNIYRIDYRPRGLFKRWLRVFDDGGGEPIIRDKGYFGRLLRFDSEKEAADYAAKWFPRANRIREWRVV